MQTRSTNRVADFQFGSIWTAVTERGGDTAFGMPAVFQSCVALRFPPQSRMAAWLNCEISRTL